ncbi:MAG: vWA domain-containing protein, partial [Candidatus Latescibacterota bacterium]
RAALGLAWMLVLLGSGPARPEEGPRLDVAFLLDATGSMGDEIDAVKERIREMIAQIAAGEPTPDVRFGIVAYRDRGDEYVTRLYPLTRDIDRIVANLDEIHADGGGDTPESLNEALHVVLHDLEWDAGPQASRLVFVIADAPPHLDYPDDFDYVEESQMALELGITVHTIGASGLDPDGERILQEIAQISGGQFQWLAYQSRYTDEDGEEVVVVVEGRTATYTKGDSTWTAEDGGAGMWAGGGGRGGVLTMDGAPEAALGAGVEGGVAPAGGPASPVQTSTNLADLITARVREAAEARGVDYEAAGTTTALRSASWAQVKRRAP